MPGPASITVGGTGTYPFSARNSAGGAATTGTYTIDDILPAGITISTVPTGTGWTCTSAPPVNNVGSTRVTCTSATVIAAGGTNAHKLTVLVAATVAAPPTATNTPTISQPLEAAGLTGSKTTT